MTEQKITTFSESKVRATMLAPPGYYALRFDVDKAGTLTWWTDPIVAFGEEWIRTIEQDERCRRLREWPWERLAWSALTLDRDTGMLDLEPPDSNIAAFLGPDDDVESWKISESVRSTVASYCRSHKLPDPFATPNAPEAPAAGGAPNSP